MLKGAQFAKKKIPREKQVGYYLENFGPVLGINSRAQMMHFLFWTRGKHRISRPPQLRERFEGKSPSEIKRAFHAWADEMLKNGVMRAPPAEKIVLLGEKLRAAEKKEHKEGNLKSKIGLAGRLKQARKRDAARQRFEKDVASFSQ